jgi:hypothetical protein
VWHARPGCTTHASATAGEIGLESSEKSAVACCTLGLPRPGRSAGWADKRFSVIEPGNTGAIVTLLHVTWYN